MSDWLIILKDFTPAIVGSLSVLAVLVLFMSTVAKQLGLRFGRDRVDTPGSDFTGQIDVFRYQLDQLRKSLSEKSVVTLDDDTKINLANRATEFLKTVTNQKLEDDLVAKFGKKAFVERNLVSQISEAADFATGLKLQISSQRNNANVNLFIGLMFAIVGLGAMSYVFYEGISLTRGERSISSVLDFFVHFVPRFGLVVLIESVAFFFLNLYREDRSLIKFLRNELTNVEFKFAALFAAIRFADLNSLKAVIALMAKVERNFTIKKNERVMSDIVADETTIMFERFFDKFAVLLSKQGK